VIKLIVHPTDLKHNFAINIDRNCFNSDVQPVVKDLVGDNKTTISSPFVYIYQHTVEIVVTLDKADKPGYYIGTVHDRLCPDSDPIALLKLRIF
jgi:hypothetical protein